MGQPLVSVIVLNWNRKKDTANVIRQLYQQTYKNYEVIVVDNYSSDNSVKYIKKYYPKVKVVVLEKNYALAGFNFGMQQAKGQYLLLAASDGIFDQNLIKKHLEKLGNNSKLGVSCPSTYIWPTKQYQGPNRAVEGDNIKGYQVTYFDGNEICLRQEVFQRTGGYSADYFICLEELEWAVRILAAGFDIRCFTDIVVFNKKSKQGGEYRKRMGFYYSRNWIWFYAQYLSFAQIPMFLMLHLKSFLNKTGKGGSMNKSSCFLGVLAGLLAVSKFILKRRPMSANVLKRVKADLFPNKRHLYIQ